MTSNKLGDNAQALAVAQALGWPSEVKRLVFTGLNHFHFRLFGPSLYKVDIERSSPLVPPWPDLVLTIGRRSIPVALWIRDQSQSRTKLVQVGQSRVGFDCFALTFANPQYRLPDHPNIFRLRLPLLYSDPTAITAVASEWTGRFVSFPRPWTAVLIGGSTVPFVLDAGVARHLMRQARQVVTREGGSLLVTTSRRTPKKTADVIEAEMPSQGFFYRWTAGNQENPYFALLGLADRFIVTGDSISMLVEVVRQGKPLAIYPLPSRLRSMRLWFRRGVQHLLFGPIHEGSMPNHWRQRLGERLVRLGLLEYQRDFSLFHQQLIAQGLAVCLGDPFIPVRHLPSDDLPQVVERIKALF